MVTHLKREAAKFLRWRQEQSTLVDELRQPERASILDETLPDGRAQNGFRYTTFGHTSHKVSMLVRKVGG